MDKPKLTYKEADTPPERCANTASKLRPDPLKIGLLMVCQFTALLFSKQHNKKNLRLTGYKVVNEQSFLDLD